MKICYDNIENLKYSKKTGRWYRRHKTYHYIESCKICNEPFLSLNPKSPCCTLKCLANTEESKSRSKTLLSKFYHLPKSETHKLNLSNSKKGKGLGPDNPNFNNKWSDEKKKQASEYLKGNGLGKKKPWFSIKISGSGNPNWKGGKSFELYCVIWKDKEYKYSIRERDSYTCQNISCRGSSKKLCIHHIDYDKKNCNPKNLVTLCFSCNARANFQREFWTEHYKKIIRSK